jgi:cell division protein FtsZ
VIAAGFDRVEGRGSNGGLSSVSDGPRTAPTKISELFADTDDAEDPLADDDDDFDVPSFLK